MESHVPQADRRGATSTRRRRSDRTPLDAAWLEQQALDVLHRAETSRRGLRDKLERRLRARCERTGEDPDTALDLVPDLVDRLAERGYVDDHRFAAAHYDRARRSGRSRERIHAALISKGVDSSTIADVEADRRDASDSAAESRSGRDYDDELAAAYRLARKRRIGPFCPDAERRHADRNRQLGILARAGFSREVTTHVIDAELADDDLESLA